MHSENSFYKSFRDAILDLPDGVDESQRRLEFILHHYGMLPREHEGLIFSLARSFPTVPVYLFLDIGVLGSNIARYSVVKRLGSHANLSSRTGCFYKMIAHSRFGKGISMDFISHLGMVIQKQRARQFRVYHASEDSEDENGALSKKQIFENASCKRPKSLFLQGGNGLQTQSEAGMNGGCGLILVPEIKSGKGRYSDIDGSYSPLLTFYDNHLPGYTYRKADKVLDISNCRIQLVAGGVTEDWVEFIKRSGPKSGTLARVLPVIG